MVFGKQFDKSLWLMINSNNKNRNNISNFIKIIPMEMYNYICEKIQENDSYVIRGYSKAIDFEPKIMLGTDGFICEIQCGINFGVLVIKMHRYTVGMAIDEKFELNLSVLHDKDLSFSVNYYDIEIGSFSYDGNTTDLFGYEDKHISYKNKYLIRKVVFDRVMVYSTWKIGGKIISIKDMPNEMHLEDLNDINQKTMLVRSRKISNRVFGR